MNELEEYYSRLSDEQALAFKRMNDEFRAALAMDTGENQERVLDAVYADAAALESATHMASIRVIQLISMFERGANAEGFRLFGTAMELLEHRRHEIPEDTAEALAAIVLQPLDVMMDDPAVPRGAIEGFLDQLEQVARRSGQGKADLALARAYWHAHLGESEACREWTDRWLTDDSNWWTPEKARTVDLMSVLLGEFDSQAALDHLERRLPAIADQPHRVISPLVRRAGFLALCGRNEEGWRELAAVLADWELSDLTDCGATWALVRACDEAPLEGDASMPGARAIVAAAEEALDTGAVEDAAAVARFHLLRGDEAAGAERAAHVRALADAYDARNGTGHHRALLERRWFADV